MALCVSFFILAEPLGRVNSYCMNMEKNTNSLALIQRLDHKKISIHIKSLEFAF